MKIGWIQDFAPGSPGGQELDRQAVMVAVPLGYDVRVCTPEAFDPECDAYVVCSVLFASREQLDLLTRRPHVVWSRDLWILPRNLGWKRNCFPQLCASATLCLFASPLHQDEFLRANCGGVRVNAGLAMSPLNPDPFLAVRGVGRRKGNLWTGDFGNPRRGLRAAVEWCAERHEELDVLGYGAEPPDFVLSGKYSAWVNLLPKVPYSQMPQVYADHARYVLLPSILDPCGRGHMEATLAGLEVVGNELCGVTSFEWWSRAQEDVEVLAGRLRPAAANFWKLAGPALEAGVRNRDG